MSDAAARDSQAGWTLELLASRIRTLRDHYGWSLSQLAERAGVTKSLLKHIENGRANPAIAEVLRIADGAGLTLSQLLGDALDLSSYPLEPATGHRYPDADAIATVLGASIRFERIARTWIEREFAERSGISRTMLYYIESGAVLPTTAILARIAAAFGTTVAALVDAVAFPTVSVVRSETHALEPRHLETTLFHAAGAFDAVEIAECRVERGGAEPALTAPAGAAVVLYVLAGSLEVRVGERCVELKRGDSALVRGRRAFSVTWTGTAPTRVLWFLSSCNPKKTGEPATVAE